MTTMYTRKETLANRYNLELRDVCCINCKYWGYNNGKPMNNVGETFADIFARNVERSKK